ncbi:hypothetical protein VR46_29255, partial [Streptomyces sp. NRRL S-444]
MEQLPSFPGERPEETNASLESAYTATATISEQGIVTEWSDDARRLLGYTPSEIVGVPAAELLADGLADASARLPAGQERWSGTVALRHRDGRRLEVGLLAHRLASTDGTARWLVASAVTREPGPPWGEPLQEWAFTQSPCFLAIFDADLRLVRANAGMERTLSLTEDEMRGLRLPEIAPDPVSDETEGRMRLVLETGEAQYVDSFVRSPGAGTQHGWATSLAPLCDPDGRVRAVSLAAHERTAGEGDRQRILVPDVADARIGTAQDTAHT